MKAPNHPCFCPDFPNGHLALEHEEGTVGFYWGDPRTCTICWGKPDGERPSLPHVHAYEMPQFSEDKGEEEEW